MFRLFHLNVYKRQVVSIIKKELYRKIIKIIKDYDEIVLARHIGPDPDAVSYTHLDVYKRQG